MSGRIIVNGKNLRLVMSKEYRNGTSEALNV